MGGGSYSGNVTKAFTSTSRAAGYADTFKRDADIKSGKIAAAIAEALNPLMMKNGVRESCDSDEHPESRAIAVFLDVTGSMRNVPKNVMRKLPELMGAITKHGAIEHPQLLFGAVGDAYCDSFPMQIGQFESSNVMDTQLSDFILEGGGGGNSSESYDLVMYFLARCCEIDCYKKRGQKGYAFLIEDEPITPKLYDSHVGQVFGQKTQPMSFEDIVKEAQEKWDIFIIRPASTSHGRNKGVTDEWKALFPQRVIELADEENICETIALALAAVEGVDIDDMARDFVKSGTSLAKIDAITKTIVLSAGKAIVPKSAKAEGTLVVAGETAGAERL